MTIRDYGRWSVELRDITFGEMRTVHSLDSEGLVDLCVDDVKLDGQPWSDIDAVPNNILLAAVRDALQEANRPFCENGDASATTAGTAEAGL